VSLLLRCPVCRAGDNSGPQCRRCKADLTLLVRLEEERDRQLQAARRGLSRGAAAGLLHARRAHALRSDADSLRLLALGHLQRRDFAAAWHFYCQLATTDR
jgi:hypothetical protein